MTVPTGLTLASGRLGGGGRVVGNVSGRFGGIVVRDGCTTGFANGVASAWLACSSAVANAFTLTKRCFGSFANAVSTTCSTSAVIVGTFLRKDGGGVNACCIAISIAVPL